MKKLTAFQRDLLNMIAGLGHPNGLEVNERVKDHYQNEINHGRLYPNLETLLDEGHVEKGELDQRTNFYELTERGQETI